MLVRCSTRTQVLVLVASTKVALSLQGVRLAKSRRKGSSGLHYVRELCLFRARAVQPARTWATLSGALLHSLNVTWPVVSVCVFWLAYNLVGSNC